MLVVLLKLVESTTANTNTNTNTNTENIKYVQLHMCSRFVQIENEAAACFDITKFFRLA